MNYDDYIESKKGELIESTKLTNLKLNIKQVDPITALNALFNENKLVLVEYNGNNCNYVWNGQRILKLGSNISVTSEIPVTVLIHGKWYLYEND